MARFHIDDPEIDVAALEARVQAAIEGKRGTRFTDEELRALRQAELEPPLRREDLPRGLHAALARVRARLPEIPPPPPPEAAAASQVPAAAEAEPEPVDPSQLLYSSATGGFRGRALRLLRRLARPVIRVLVNADHTLHALRAEMLARDARQRQLLEQAFDLLKDNVDRRIDRTADWAGQGLSRLTGQLEARREADDHLLHNLVFELTDVRLDLRNLEARIAELSRRVEDLRARERALQEIALAGTQERGGRGAAS